MPYFSISTNIVESTSDEIIAIISAKVAEIIKKPEQYVMIQINHQQKMSFAGSTEPLAYCQFKSLGLSKDQTSLLSEQLCQLIEDQLNIPSERIYIQFSSPERSFWGWNKQTF